MLRPDANRVVNAPAFSRNAQRPDAGSLRLLAFSVKGGCFALQQFSAAIAEGEFLGIERRGVMAESDLQGALVDHLNS
jgi:hypothetical protein